MDKSANPAPTHRRISSASDRVVKRLIHLTKNLWTMEVRVVNLQP